VKGGSGGFGMVGVLIVAILAFVVGQYMDVVKGLING
jgi:hypothetical protein